MPVDAVLIAPAMVDGKVLIPAGSVLKGKVTKAQPVGMAVVHETAALTVAIRQAGAAKRRHKSIALPALSGGEFARESGC